MSLWKHLTAIVSFSPSQNLIRTSETYKSLWPIPSPAIRLVRKKGPCGWLCLETNVRLDGYGW